MDFGQILPQAAARTNASVEVFEGELFVGAMGTVVVESPAHEENIGVEEVDHFGHDGDGAAFADEDRFFAEPFGDGALGGGHEGAIGIDYDSVTTMEIDDFDADARGRVAVDKLLKLLGDGRG